MNNLQQRRQKQMQQMGGIQPQQNEFMAGYNMGNSLGGAAFGGVNALKNDGKFDGTDLTKLDGYDKTLSDEQNHQNLLGKFNQPDGSIGTAPYSDIANSGERFVSSDPNGDTNIDAIGAFMNGYTQQITPYPNAPINSSPLTNATNMNFGNYSGNIDDYIARRKGWF